MIETTTPVQPNTIETREEKRRGAPRKPWNDQVGSISGAKKGTIARFQIACEIAGVKASHKLEEVLMDAAELLEDPKKVVAGYDEQIRVLQVKREAALKRDQIYKYTLESPEVEAMLQAQVDDLLSPEWRSQAYTFLPDRARLVVGQFHGLTEAMVKDEMKARIAKQRRRRN